MTCPKCAGDMRTYERTGVIVDQCRDCRGLFLDRGELERLVDLEGGGPAPATSGAAPAAPEARPEPVAPPPAATYPDPRRAPEPRYAPDQRYASDPRYAPDPRSAADPRYPQDPRASGHPYKPPSLFRDLLYGLVERAIVPVNERKMASVRHHESILRSNEGFVEAARYFRRK